MLYLVLNALFYVIHGGLCKISFQKTGANLSLPPVLGSYKTRSLIECAMQCYNIKECESTSFNKDTEECSLSVETRLTIYQSFVPELGATTISKVCENGWYSYLENCYLLSVQYVDDIDTAMTLCASVGAYLTDIADEQEYEFLLALVQTHTWANTQYNSVWLGISDVHMEGNFTSVHDGSEVSPGLLKWGLDQPNDYQNQDCVLLIVAEQEFGLMHDFTCSGAIYGQGVICKKQS